jgi:hypothetical protein
MKALKWPLWTAYVRFLAPQWFTQDPRRPRGGDPTSSTRSSTFARLDRSLFARLERWLWTQRQRELEQSLADPGRVDARRRLHERVPTYHRYY